MSCYCTLIMCGSGLKRIILTPRFSRVEKTKTSQLGFEFARRIFLLLLKSRFYARVLENKSETPQKTKRLVEVIVNCCNTLIR